MWFQEGAKTINKCSSYLVFSLGIFSSSRALHLVGLPQAVSCHLKICRLFSYCLNAFLQPSVTAWTAICLTHRAWMRPMSYSVLFVWYVFYLSSKPTCVWCSQSTRVRVHIQENKCSAFLSLLISLLILNLSHIFQTSSILTVSEQQRLLHFFLSLSKVFFPVPPVFSVPISKLVY